MIRRHRGRILPGGIGYSDSPTFGGFGPKSPCSEHAMEMGDLEAAFVGNLARYCMAIGSIPRRPIKGFWWVNGVCRGVKGGFDEDEFDLFGNPNGFDYLHEVREVVQHLRTWAPAIVKTEGVEELLSTGDDVRWYSLEMFPQENPHAEPEWLNLDEVMKLTGRSFRTIKNWSEEGSVTAIGTGRDAIYSRQDIQAHMKLVQENLVRNAANARLKRP